MTLNSLCLPEAAMRVLAQRPTRLARLPAGSDRVTPGIAAGGQLVGDAVQRGDPVGQLGPVPGVGHGGAAAALCGSDALIG